MRFTGWATLAALLVSTAPALAAQGTLSGTSATPILVQGDRLIEAPDSVMVATGDEGQLALLLQGTGGHATRIVQRAFGVVTAQGAEILWFQDVERHPLDLDGALLSLVERRPEFQLLVDSDAQLSQGARPAELSLGIQADPIRITETLRAPLSVQVVSDAQPFDRTIPAGLYVARGDAGHMVADGAFTMYVAGARLQFVDRSGVSTDIHAYFHTETRSGTIYNPLTGAWTGGGSHTEYVQEYVVADGEGHLDLAFQGPPVRVLSAAPVAHVTGTATLPRMVGAVTIQQDEPVRHDVDGHDLTVSGRFSLHLSNPELDGATRVRGSGDFTTVSYGPVRATYDWATAVAVGLGALVLAGIAWVATNAKAILGAAGGGALALYARVHGDEVLEHPGRSEVYERVKAMPGVNFVDLSRAVPFGASTLNYHLRVLERNGYVVSVRDGRYLRFFDRTSGSYSGGRKMAVSALRNPTTAAMAHHIRDNPGVAQCDLASRFQVTPSTVTWHVTRLAAQGLVTKVRKGAYTRYYLGDGWGQLPADELARHSRGEEVAA